MSGPQGKVGSTIYPLVRGRLYTVAALRDAENSLLAQRRADQELSSRLRVQDRKEIEWAKIRNEEWSPLKLLVDGLKIDGSETFRWTPDGAPDFEITSAGETLNVQCTMAYDQLSGTENRGATCTTWKCSMAAGTASTLEVAQYRCRRRVMYRPIS